MVVFHIHSVTLLTCFILFYISSGKSISKSLLRRPPREVGVSRTAVADLVREGNRFHSDRKHKDALVYYSAVMKSLEGTVRESDIHTRRYCELQAADCEMLLGNYLQAIARCSEVISEVPECIIDSEIDLVYSLAELSKWGTKGDANAVALELGRAYLIRAKCCIAVGRSHQAQSDLSKASTYIADEPEVYELMSSMDKPEEGSRADRQGENAAEAQAGENAAEHSDHEFLESCILQHPPMHFTRKQLRRLTLRSRRSRSRDLATAAQAPLSKSSALPATASVGRAFAGQAGSWLSKPMVASLLTSLLGMRQADAENAAEAVGALAEVWKGARRAYAEVNKRRKGIVASLTAFWTLATIWPVLASGIGLRAAH